MISFRKKLASAFFALICLFSLSGISVSAASQKLFDYADLVPADEEASLEQKLQSIEDAYGHGVFVYTTNDLNGDDPENRTVELVYDSSVVPMSCDSGIIYFVDMEDRKYDIYSFGVMNTDIMITPIRNSMADELRSHLSNGDFTKAFNLYADKVKKEIEDVASNGPNRPASKAPLIAGIGCVIITLIVMLILKGTMNTVRPAVLAKDYEDKGSFDIRTKKDIFLYSTYSRVKMSSNSSGGSRGGGGHSSGSF